MGNSLQQGKRKEKEGEKEEGAKTGENLKGTSGEVWVSEASMSER